MIPNAANVRIGQDVEVITTQKQPTRTYRINFDTGRIYGFVDDTEAMKQAIFKILETERYHHLIYSWNYGIEMNAIIGKSYQVLSSEIKRVIREALLSDSRIEDVSDFSIARIGNRTVSVSFVASTIFGQIPIERKVTTGV